MYCEPGCGELQDHVVRSRQALLRLYSPFSMSSSRAGRAPAETRMKERSRDYPTGGLVDHTCSTGKDATRAPATTTRHGAPQMIVRAPGPTPVVEVATRALVAVVVTAVRARVAFVGREVLADVPVASSWTEHVMNACRGCACGGDQQRWARQPQPGSRVEIGKHVSASSRAGLTRPRPAAASWRAA